jgi:hypothetical protein
MAVDCLPEELKLKVSVLAQMEHLQMSSLATASFKGLQQQQLPVGQVGGGYNAAEPFVVGPVMLIYSRVWKQVSESQSRLL